jgi:UDP:flavonoid glycosyltransferase YjiC (YdhE family)
MKVLITSVSAIGHVHPIVPLALALRGAGHGVRWATGPDGCQRLAEVGIDTVVAGVPWEDFRAEYRRRNPGASTSGVGQPDHVFPRLFGEIIAPRMFADILPVARAWRPDLIVRDAGEFGGAVVAALLGIPTVTHAFGPLTPRSRVAAAAEAVKPVWQSAGLAPRPFGGIYEHLYLDIYPPSLQAADMSHVPRHQLLQPVPFDGTGPSVGSWEPPGSLKPLVYLTFGTVERDRGPLQRAIEAIAATGVRLLVTVGPTRDPATFGPQPEDVRIERHVPQSAVLPRAAAVVSHAGSGTVLAALSHGLPLVCLPQAADQFLNAEACRRAGAGVSLDQAEADGPAIARALTRVLAEASFREHSRAIAQEISRMPDPGTVVEVLERLAAAFGPARPPRT